MLIGALLAGCVPQVSPPPRSVAPAPPPPPARHRPPEPDRADRAEGLESVIGASARALVATFGSPALDVREGPARKLQFVGPPCVLDLYLYPARDGAEAVVTYVDARLPDGRDTDRAACVAALSRSS